MIRIPLSDEASWLAERLKHVTASEVSVILGENPWKTIDELWEEKTGLREPKDLSDKEQIQLGKAYEPIIRDEFSLLYKDRYDMEYHPYDILCHDEHPFISGTLDGELTDKRTGERGVWEAKSTTVRSKEELQGWNHVIPRYYFSQVVAHLLITGWQFEILTAKIIYQSGLYVEDTWIPDEFNTIYTKNYLFRATNDVVAESMEYVRKRCCSFWLDHVLKRQRPATIILPF